MLALLPPGEEDGILFKTLYVTKLPKEVRGHVLANGMHLNSRELSKLADDLWCGLNERHSGAKSHHVAAAVPDDGEEHGGGSGGTQLAAQAPPAQEDCRQGRQGPGEALPRPQEVRRPDVEVC